MLKLTQGKVGIIPTNVVICKLRSRVSVKWMLFNYGIIAEVHNFSVLFLLLKFIYYKESKD